MAERFEGIDAHRHVRRGSKWERSNGEPHCVAVRLDERVALFRRERQADVSDHAVRCGTEDGMPVRVFERHNDTASRSPSSPSDLMSVAAVLTASAAAY